MIYLDLFGQRERKRKKKEACACGVDKSVQGFYDYVTKKGRKKMDRPILPFRSYFEQSASAFSITEHLTERLSENLTERLTEHLTERLTVS